MPVLKPDNVGAYPCIVDLKSALDAGKDRPILQCPQTLRRICKNSVISKDIGAVVDAAGMITPDLKSGITMADYYCKADCQLVQEHKI